MAEDDVERLVAPLIECGEKYASQKNHPAVLLARIVRELLAELPVGECEWKHNDGYSPCPEGSVVCPLCRARALRERCNRLARGEEPCLRMTES